MLLVGGLLLLVWVFDVPMTSAYNAGVIVALVEVMFKATERASVLSGTTIPIKAGWYPLKSDLILLGICNS